MSKIPRAHLVAAAESFAGVSRHADAIYRYYLYDDQRYREIVANHYYGKLARTYRYIPTKYHTRIVDVALIEITKPIPPTRAWAWPERERCLCAGISRMTWRKHGMNTALEWVIRDIIFIAQDVANQVSLQLATSYKKQIKNKCLTN